MFPRSARTGGRRDIRVDASSRAVLSGAPGGTGPVGTDSKPKGGPPPTPNVPARRQGVGAVLRGRGGSLRVVAWRPVPTLPGSLGGSARRRGSGGAGAEVRHDLVDHRRLRDEGDDPHDAVARGARERVDLEELLEERRPPAGGLRRRQSWRVHDRQRCTGRDGLLLGPHPARAV